MSLSERFQNSDSFIYVNGIFFPTATALEHEEQTLFATQIQSSQQAVSHWNEEFYPNISNILQLLLTVPVGSCSCVSIPSADWEGY